MQNTSTSHEANSRTDRRAKPRQAVVARFRLAASKVRQFLLDDDGPTAVEYAVMLSLIIAVCITAVSSIGSNAARVFSKVANSI